jgi:hypothetical protein
MQTTSIVEQMQIILSRQDTIIDYKCYLKCSDNVIYIKLFATHAFKLFF